MMTAIIALLALAKRPAADYDWTTLAKDTWHCIASLESETGLPYDNSDHGANTSVSNTGIYLTSVICAKSLGNINEAEANQRLARTLSSIEKLQRWQGFQQSWNDVHTLRPGTGDTWVSLLDSANLAAGLLTVSQTDWVTPDLSARSMALFRKMEWSTFYDSKQDAILGGFNTTTLTYNERWHLDQIGTDAELAQFFAVAAGNAPPRLWSRFGANTETRDGYTYLKPGWEGGGLFMQYISGMWLDNSGTILGSSARKFAQSQMARARRIASSAWGWSASTAPNGEYLGWGRLTDEVVTPHASMLSVESFPNQVADNLRALTYLGARSPEDGFYDSVNVRTKALSKKFLILDQGMLYISLTNYLTHGKIRHDFQTAPIVRSGRARIKFFPKA